MNTLPIGAFRVGVQTNCAVYPDPRAYEISYSLMRERFLQTTYIRFRRSKDVIYTGAAKLLQAPEGKDNTHQRLVDAVLVDVYMNTPYLVHAIIEEECVSIDLILVNKENIQYPEGPKIVLQ
jgi:hypothetical protein